MNQVDCPNCEDTISVRDDIDLYDTLTCDSCNTDLYVAGIDPIELEIDESDDDDGDEE